MAEGLKTPTGLPDGAYRVGEHWYWAGRRLWTAADDAELRRRYADMRSDRLAADIGRSLRSVYARAAQLGLHKSPAYLASPDACRLRRDNSGGIPFRFKKGLVPHNKGQRRPGWHRGRMRETQFKKGHPGTNTMPVGSTRLIEGYVYRKVSDVPNVPYTVNWKLDQVLVWERTHGPVPIGHVVAFKNGERQDIRLDNLELIPRAELARRNRMWNRLPKPLASTIHLLGQVKRRIREKEEK